MKPKQQIDPAQETLAKLDRVKAAVAKIPKPQINAADAAGNKALRLLTEDGTANASLKNLRSAKAARKEQLKQALTIVWEALESGATVNGYTTKDEWATKFAGVTDRTIQHILYGRAERKANTGSPKLALTLLDTAYNPRKDAKYLALVADVAPVDANGREITGNMHVKLDVVVKGPKNRETLDACAVKMTALMKQLRLWDKENAKRFKEYLEEVATERELTSTPAPSSKKAQPVRQPKEVKHVFNKSITLSWCRTKVNLNNTARQAKHATCPYCIAAMAAGIPVMNPTMERRWIERELKEAHERLPDLESRVELCLPEYRDEAWQRHKEEIPKLREKITKLGQELEEAKKIKTPEQAVEAAKKAKAERGEAWQRAAEDTAEQFSVRPVSPKFNKKELKAYETLKAKLDKLSKQFLDSEITAEQWRLGFRLLDDENIKREVFSTRHGQYMHWMKDVRTRMEAEIAREANRENHTGQHEEDCPECFEHQMEQERLQLRWRTAYESWRKRIQTLIDTWRNGRLREESKYREEFEAAGEKFQKRLKREGIERVNIMPIESILHEARGRMEGAIEDRKRTRPYLSTEPEQVSERAQALAATVDSAVLPSDAEAILRVGTQCRENPACDPNNEGEEQL
jgi:hypothetical protein